MKRLRSMTVAVLIMLSGGYTFAQNAESKPTVGGVAFGLGLALGANTLEDDTGTIDMYQRLGLQPNLTIGQLGIGLDFAINYRLTNTGSVFTFREEDWIPSDTVNWIELYLPKIDSIRYAQKGDPLFVRFGSFSDATIGNGFIVDDYSNERFLPELRILGAKIDVDGALIRFPSLGLESLVGNVAALDVIATRLYLRPFVAVDPPVLQPLQFGFTFAADLRPFFHEKKNMSSVFSKAYATAHAANPAIGVPPLKAPQDKITMFGFDLRFPIVTAERTSFAIFGDFVLQNKTSGAMVGVGGRAFGFLLYEAQGRYLGKNFIPSYFDGAYDLRRVERFAIYQSGTATITPSIWSWRASLGVGLWTDAVVFSTTASGPFKVIDRLHPAELGSSLTVREGAVPGVAWLGLQAFYRKFGIRNFQDLATVENSVIGGRINIHSDPVVISLRYSLTYDPNSDGDPWRVASGIETTMSLR